MQECMLERSSSARQRQRYEDEDERVPVYVPYNLATSTVTHTQNRRLSDDKDKQLQRKVSDLQTQTQRLERKIALIKTENDLLKKKQDDQRPMEEKVKVLKKRNAELAAIARRLEEKAKHLQQENMKKIRDETGQHDSEYLKKMFARQRAKDLAEHAKAMLSKDREIEDLRKKCQELADALSNNDFLGPEESVCKLHHQSRWVIDTAVKSPVSCIKCTSCLNSIRILFGRGVLFMHDTGMSSQLYEHSGCQNYIQLWEVHTKFKISLGCSLHLFPPRISRHGYLLSSHIDFVSPVFQGAQAEAKKLKELEVTNEALEKEISRLEKAKSETERLEVELAQKKIECETLSEEIRLEKIKTTHLETVVQESASQNTQLTIQVSDLQHRLLQLEKSN
ncbi:Peripheral-type benzodiazepine receptor-associated protein 1 [Mizuhopecten yessoensis]|uniref:Peripheral-type benzodiazepine receptor-associated protein 1 n=1 Tax=Mizuhopecten yessoensis TaxID=6573 RepID=A0A210PQV6_MIZYE|nr:Peripheral-type benzodiazepine receptor-associated protein 1 [Mizuhopecten yessoensis]